VFAGTASAFLLVSLNWAIGLRESRSQAAVGAARLAQARRILRESSVDLIRISKRIKE
jgi:hypothetical protein